MCVTSLFGDFFQLVTVRCDIFCFIHFSTINFCFKFVSEIQAKPVVDTIQEHEKYGNEGDKFYGAGRALVNTFEGFANIVNKLIDVSSVLCSLLLYFRLFRCKNWQLSIFNMFVGEPQENYFEIGFWFLVFYSNKFSIILFFFFSLQSPTRIAKSFSQTITEKLNQIGGKIVGL